MWPGLRASLSPDSRSPRRFAAERDGQIEDASILDRFPGPEMDKLSVRSKVGEAPVADLGPPFLTRLEKLSPKMMLTARHIAEIMTFQSKSSFFIRNHDFSDGSATCLSLFNYVGVG